MKLRLKQILKVCLMLIFAGLTVTGHAQTSVSGVVTDSKDGKPLVGVTVTLKGTKTAVTTNATGAFTINAPANGTLIFSSIGFTVIQKEVSSKTPMQVRMIATNQQLDEVVVIGYGTQKRKEVTGAIVKVSGDKISTLAAPSFEAALQGKAAGVQVVQGSGLAGSGSVVRIRGIGSISAGGDPLYVVDGIPITSDQFLRGDGGGMNQNPLSAINPNEIESIEVLKDAGAAGIYGSRGANGVILVTTKRGKIGKPKFNYTNKLGFVTYTQKPEFVNGTEYMQLKQEAWQNDGNVGQIPSSLIPSGLSFATASSTNTDWWKEVTRTGLINEHNLSMHYGNKKFKSFIAGTFGKSETYIKRNSFQRQSIRTNLDYTFSNKLKVFVNAAYNRGINDRISIWETIAAVQGWLLPIHPIYKTDGSYSTLSANPVRYFNETKYRNTDDRYLGGIILDYNPISNLNLKASASMDYLFSFEDQWESKDFTNDARGGIAKRYPIWVKNNSYNFTANYLYKLNDKNKFNFLVGAETQESEVSNTNGDIYAWGQDAPLYKNKAIYKDSLNKFLNDNTRKKQVVDNSTFASFFARINFASNDKYFLQVSARRDGSSKFGTNNKYGFFPTASAAWVLSDEKFLKNNNFINNLKLRTSYGLVGNSNIATGKYYYGYGNNRNYNNTPVLDPYNIGNPDLKWETVRNFDLGLDFGLLNNKLTGEISYYRKVTVDQLLEPGLGASSGFQKSWRNLEGGKILNEGVELTLNYILVKKQQLYVSVGGNISKNYNEVLNLGSIGADALQGGFNDTRIAEGYPVGTNFLVRYHGVDPTDGLPIWLDKNGNQTKTFSLDHRVMAGKVLPNFSGAFNTEIAYKTVEFKTLWTFVSGGNIYDGSAKYQNVGNNWNIRRDLLDRWTKPGDVAKYPRLTNSVTNYPGLGTNDNYNSTMFLYDASFMRLREISLAYKLPKGLLQKTPFSNAKISLVGMNLLTFSKYPGADPEITRDFQNSQDRNMSPNITFLTPTQAKSFVFSLNLNF
ncbi:MAG: TonB-dependent receptor [Ferruginibacter sp.]|nr:TonB-dependent receptor [Ferruginibacter sp.]